MTDAPSVTASPLVTLPPLRRNSGFRSLWIGQVLSDTGTSAAPIAYPLLILALTHSTAIAGVVGTVGWLSAGARLARRRAVGSL